MFNGVLVSVNGGPTGPATFLIKTLSICHTETIAFFRGGTHGPPSDGIHLLRPDPNPTCLDCLSI